MAEPLLSIRALVTEFRTDAGTVRAVDHVSFDVPAGTTIGLVGESGCGKSVTALSVLRLIQPPGQIVSGEIAFRGKDLLRLSGDGIRRLRGGDIAMVFQEPSTSLNPVFTVGYQIVEAVELHQGLRGHAGRDRAAELLQQVGIPEPRERLEDYPHQLSGGMRQRVMIAMALAGKPALLIADEPTTALDVTIQAQILDLLERLQREMGMSVLLITHDLGIVAEFVDAIVVMYAGVVVEQAPVADLFRDPRHPYTRGLLASVPRLGGASGPGARLPGIAGVVPELSALPRGCRFQDRCPDVFDRCRESEPPLYAIGGRTVRCFLHDPARPASAGAVAPSPALAPAQP